jgi:mannan endo-1,4-beta-mannosidase
MPARPMSYLGVYEPGVPESYAAVEEFARAAGMRPNVALYYSSFDEQFQEAFAETAFQHGATTLVQIDPRNTSLADVSAGRYDVYLDLFADQVAAFRHPVIIGFGHEMNGPWSGWGYHHTPPAVFIAAWRHLVTVFRKQGADNVTWLWTINRTCPQCGAPRDWWPGARYVTWIGIDGYYYQRTDTFNTIFGPAIADVRRLTKDPILISETAVGPLAGQPRGIRNLLTGLHANRDLGLVWFDETKHGSIYHQNWRLEGNPTALAAFRRAVRLIRSG